MIIKVIFSVILFSVKVRCQLPPGYFCAPTGTCPASGESSVDVRASTPAACPSDQVACPTTSPNVCGKSTVANVSKEDGFATAGAWPWQVYMVNQSGFAGSGVLINSNTILTAAHKVVGNKDTPSMVGIYLGVTNPIQLGMRYAASAIYIHPNFSIATLIDDIALVILSVPISPLPQQFVNTACLPTQGQSFTGQTCSVAGWGHTDFTATDAGINALKQVMVEVVSYDTCYTSMSNDSLLGTNVDTYLDPVGEICAGGQAERDACTHDGGAPLVCNINNAYVIAGLVIWGKGCGQEGVYGVYVNVPHYMPWIQRTIITQTV